jgi:signal transduction histidine kinase
MRFKSRSSESAEFERGRLAGKEQERALIARRLHKGFECLTAASFAVELAKEPGERQCEFVSKASKLLDEAVELLGEVLQDKRGAHPAEAITARTATKQCR